ncbi:hypothetical protein BX661DRAFT_200012 [Kickxella alabastrina]|uniref:uncharacterized protein n=1 Tax=Kickxella alabastrina TaxID=61397 RepID=UPI002220894C|nr:uncharacterized protein BX661DRAFT_200012 [Kickxella alabastrina]KAI7823669.1 hypothetical protein BX661DRAFT_200012 [Kickxella alabastrina]
MISNLAPVRIYPLASVRSNIYKASRTRAASISTAEIALLGTLRVAQNSQIFSYPPYEVSPGCVVFVDRCNASSTQEEFIRCRLLNPQAPWFDTQVCVLITHWRYIHHPAALHSPRAGALAYIEVLSAPIILPRSDYMLPEYHYPLSWWLDQQVHPELDYEKQFVAVIRCVAPTSGNKAAKILASGASAAAGKDRRRQGLISISGRVSAVSALSAIGDGSDAFGFIIDLSVDALPPTSMSDAAGTVSIPVLLSAQRFPGIFAALFIGDLVFASDLQPSTLRTGETDGVPIFTASPTSLVFRINDFDALEDSQMYISRQSQSAFTQSSQESLLSQIALGQAAPMTAATTPKSQPGAVVHLDDRHLLAHQDKLESYEGEITKMLDLTLGIYVIDGCHILVLAYWPQFSPLVVLRPGTRVLLDNMHVVLLKNSSSYRWSWLKHIWPDRSGPQALPTDQQQALVFGACARSSVHITDFAPGSDPGLAQIFLDSDLAFALAKRAGGLARFLETAEAFWKLSKKFPSGPLSTKGSGSDAAKQILSMALVWTGATSSARRNPNTEFLAHSKHCQSSRTGAAMRVVTLGNVLRRLGLFRDIQMQSRQPARGEARLSPEVQVQASSIYPADLLLQSTPLVGRIVLGDRGEVFLWDSTGYMRVHPSCISGSRPLRGAAEPHSPLFSGQHLIGHLYSWNNWRFSIETIDVAAINKTSGAGMQQLPDFGLVYAAISSPTIMYADPNFGGATNLQLPMQSVSERIGGNGEPEKTICFVMYVHWQGAVAPVLDSPSIGSTGQSADSHSPWPSRACVKGMALSIRHDHFHQQLRNAPDGRPEIDLALTRNGDPGQHQMEHCTVHFSPRKLPVQFSPGSAYVVCLHDRSSMRYMHGGQAGSSMVVVRMGLLDHIHPVQLFSNGQRIGASQPYIAKALAIPTVHIEHDSASGSSIVERLQAPRVFSVREVNEATVAGRDSEYAAPGSLISVCGIVLQREVKRVVLFSRHKSSADSSSNVGSNSDDNANSGDPVAGLFENCITLRDKDDIVCTISLYIKLSSYTHPVGLLPGAGVIFQNVTVGAAKTTGHRYLSSTFATSIVPVSAQSTPSANPVDIQSNELEDGTHAVRLCIGQLTGWSSGDQAQRRFVLSCRVTNVESLSVFMECTACGQTVCGLSCSCFSKQHRMIDRQSPDTAYLSDSTTAQPRIELACRVSDGSGIARVVTSSALNTISMIGLTSGDVEELYQTAAQSWNGQLLWNAPAHSAWHYQDSNAHGGDDSSDPIGRMLGQAGAAAICVEGFVAGQRGRKRPEGRQMVRINGHDMVFKKHAVPRISALRVTRLDVAEQSWFLLDGI